MEGLRLKEGTTHRLIDKEKQIGRTGAEKERCR